MKRIILLLGFCFFAYLLNASGKGYEIKIKINNLKNKDIYLGYHFGEKLYVSDTATLNEKGIGVFSGKEKLKKGLYFVYLPNKTFFDIILDENQEFTVENDTFDYVKNIKIINSDLNKVFYEYQKYLNEKQALAKALRNEKKTYEDKADSVNIKRIQDQLKNLDKNVKEYIDKVISDNRNNLFGKMISLTKSVDLPDIPRNEKGEITDTFFQYRYFKQHYFNNTDFSEPGLLRTPFLESKLKEYFTSIPQHPDTLLPEAFRVIDMAKSKNDEVYQYVLSYLFNLFLKSEIMGMDAVYAGIGERYYLSGQASWADTTFLKNLADRVSKIKPNIIGKKAQNIIAPTSDGNWINLYQTNAQYIILAFWDPDCGHCQKEIPELYEVYLKYSGKNVKAIAMYTQGDQKKWLDFINEHNLNWINIWDPYNQTNFRNNYDIYSTPVIYLLDKDKKIVAKRIDVKSLDDFLSRFVK